MVSINSIQKVIESLYNGTCEIIEHVKRRTPNGINYFEESTVQTDIPCRISFSTIKSTELYEGGNRLYQSIKLFTSPTINIKPGSKIVVTQNGVTTAYKNSGESAIYKHHQEIILELFKGWS